MDIRELVPNTKEYDATCKILSGVHFHVEPMCLMAICSNEVEADYIRFYEQNSIMEWAKKKFNKETLALEIVCTHGLDGPPGVGLAGRIVGNDGLRPDLTFDNFHVDSPNKKEALLTVISTCRLPQPARSTSPNFLCLWGKGSPEKTHLLHAAIDDLSASGKSVLFFNSRDFRDFLSRGDSLERAKRMREYDVLAVDDIGFPDKDARPEAMWNFKTVLDDLIGGGRLGLFTGPYLPTERWNLSPEVATRLITGNTADL